MKNFLFLYDFKTKMLSCLIIVLFLLTSCGDGDPHKAAKIEVSKYLNSIREGDFSNIKPRWPNEESQEIISKLNVRKKKYPVIYSFQSHQKNIPVIAKREELTERYLNAQICMATPVKPTKYSNFAKAVRVDVVLKKYDKDDKTQHLNDRSDFDSFVVVKQKSMWKIKDIQKNVFHDSCDNLKILKSNLGLIADSLKNIKTDGKELIGHWKFIKEEMNNHDLPDIKSLSSELIFEENMTGYQIIKFPQMKDRKLKFTWSISEVSGINLDFNRKKQYFDLDNWYFHDGLLMREVHKFPTISSPFSIKKLFYKKHNYEASINQTKDKIATPKNSIKSL